MANDLDLIDDKHAWALYMLRELQRVGGKDSALAYALRNQIAEAEEPDAIALGLAELLADRLSDVALLQRIEECLKALRLPEIAQAA